MTQFLQLCVIPRLFLYLSRVFYIHITKTWNTLIIDIFFHKFTYRKSRKQGFVGKNVTIVLFRVTYISVLAIF